MIVLGVTMLHALIAGLAASPLFFVPNVATAQRVFGGSNGAANLFEDVRAYRDYGVRTLGGEVPYRDFLVEYPIGALPLFIAPAVGAPGPIAYRWAFAAEMMLFDALLVWLVMKRGARTIGVGRSLLWYTLMVAVLGALPIARFDLAASALAFASAMAWETGRGGLGGVLAGLGGLAKVYPLVVAGPGWIADRGHRMRGFLAVVFTVAIGLAIWMAIGGSGVSRSLQYHSGRGLENECTYAGVLIAVGRSLGRPVSQDFNHSSVELIATGAGAAAKIAPLAQVAAMGLVLALLARGRPSGRRTMAASGACILAFTVFGKVLSPQYLLWIIPFAAVLEGRSGRWARPIVLAACVFTTLVYFWAGVGLIRYHPLAVAILNARNALLLAALAVFVNEVRPDRRSAVTPEEDGSACRS